ncbi:MAG TPA: HK97 gp10 family phage protein [Chitinophagaceae bacterium]|nr:HK97 gp10 family phage protein [Chitinophagaceae bacterium]
MKVTVQVQGLTEVLQKLHTLPLEVRGEVKGILRRGADIWVRNAIAEVPVDMGALKRGINHKDISTWNTIGYAVSSNSEYSSYMEFGTKRRFKAIPGIDSSVFKSAVKEKGSGKGFYDNILNWVKRKGIGGLQTKSGRMSKSRDSQMAQEQAAFAIYLSIKRHGVKPHPFFFHQIPIVKQTIEQGLQDLKRDKVI